MRSYPVGICVLTGISSRSCLFRRLLMFLQFRCFRYPFCAFIYFVRRLRVFVRVPWVANCRYFWLYFSRQRDFIVLFFVRLGLLLFYRIARRFRRFVVCLGLFVRNFGFLMLIYRLFTVLLSVLRNWFGSGSFNCGVTVMVYVGDNVGQGGMVKRSAAAAMGNASRFLNLTF